MITDSREKKKHTNVNEIRNYRMKYFMIQTY
nr:MAG TPA: hypothetical protein [Bacteriophage sp.]